MCITFTLAWLPVIPGFLAQMLKTQKHHCLWGTTSQVVSASSPYCIKRQIMAPNHAFWAPCCSKACPCYTQGRKWAHGLYLVVTTQIIQDWEHFLDGLSDIGSNLCFDLWGNLDLRNWSKVCLAHSWFVVELEVHPHASFLSYIPCVPTPTCPSSSDFTQVRTVRCRLTMCSSPWM